MNLDIEASRTQDAFMIVAGLYTTLGVYTLVHWIRIRRHYRAWTIQTNLHALLFAICLFRSLFLWVIGYFNWCDICAGSLAPSCSSQERILFYIMDQMPNVLFFTTCTFLIFFWAKVYYCAIDQVEYLQTTIKPIGTYLNILFYTIQVLMWIMYATVWKAERHYVSKTYAAFTTISFILMTITFLSYGKGAYSQMTNIPVELRVRCRKLKEVAIVTSVWTTCFTLRSVAMLWLSVQKQHLHEEMNWFVIVMYFGVFEIVPCSVVLYYYRRVPAAIRRRTRIVKEKNGDKSTSPLYTSLLNTEN